MMGRKGRGKDAQKEVRRGWAEGGEEKMDRRR